MDVLFHFGIIRSLKAKKTREQKKNKNNILELNNFCVEVFFFKVSRERRTLRDSSHVPIGIKCLTFYVTPYNS